MKDMFLEHPDISSALKTGYPTWNQPDEEVFCGECGCSLRGKVVYDDRYYNCLCEECLLRLHRKEC